MYINELRYDEIVCEDVSPTEDLALQDLVEYRVEPTH